MDHLEVTTLGHRSTVRWSNAARFELSNAYDGPLAATFDVPRHDDLDELLRFCGAEIRLTHDTVAACRFEGRIRRILKSPIAGLIRFEAESSLGPLELSRSTKTFAPPNRRPTRLCELPGIASLWNGVQGLQLLDVPVEQFTQFDESPAEALVRAARLCRRATAYERSTGRLSVVAWTQGATRKIPLAQVMAESVDVRISLAPAVAVIGAWDPRTGARHPETRSAIGANWSPVVAARSLAGSGEDLRLHLNELAEGVSLQAVADHLAGEAAGSTLEIVCDLFDCDIDVHHVINLVDLLPDVDLRVVSSTLCTSADRSVLNRVVLRPAMFPVAPEHSSSLLSRPSQVVTLAEVIDARDADYRGRIAVTPNWPIEGGAVFVEGLPKVAGKSGGDFVLPRPGDWGWVSIDVRGGSLGRWLGAVWRGNARAPDSDGASFVQPFGSPEVFCRAYANQLEFVVAAGGKPPLTFRLTADGMNIVN